MVSDDYRDFVLEQLRRALPDPVTHRAMFGGVGLYASGLFFALIAEDVLYLKVDDVTRPEFEARGLGPFLPYGDPDRPMQYYPLPAEVLEEPELLSEWAVRAIETARRAKSASSGKRQR